MSVKVTELLGSLAACSSMCQHTHIHTHTLTHTHTLIHTRITSLLFSPQTFPKRFKVTELFGALAACSSMRIRIPPITLRVLMEQSVRGLKYATHEDLANALVALHKVPR